MAELTEEQKIVIGVCVAVAGIVIIGIAIFICCLFHRRNRKVRKRHYHKERIIDYPEKRPYTIYEDRYTNGYGPPPNEPKPLPYLPPPPMRREIMYDQPPPRREIIYDRPPPMKREIMYERSRPVDPILVKYDRGWDNMSDTAVEKRYNGENRWNSAFRSDPIVVPMSKPEFQVSDYRYPREADTIYLKYNDDQALLRQTNVLRRSAYGSGGYSGYGGGGLRRTRSVVEVRKSTPYVGEWYRRNDNMDEFNANAARAGRDPFLWKSQRN